MTNTSSYTSVSAADWRRISEISRKGRHQIRLLDSIEVEVDIPGRTVLGIVLDADDNPSARWQALTDRLNRLRQEDHFDLPELPAQPEPSGTIIEGRLRIGIWLMPDNVRPENSKISLAA